MSHDGEKGPLPPSAAACAGSQDVPERRPPAAGQLPAASMSVSGAKKSRAAAAAVAAVLHNPDSLLSRVLDENETAAAAAAVQKLPASTLETAASLLKDLPTPLVPLVIAKSTTRRGKGGRQPAADPRLDPNMDPKRAMRILKNRLSAARSKLKQKLLNEGQKARQEVLAARKAAAVAAAGSSDDHELAQLAAVAAAVAGDGSPDAAVAVTLQQQPGEQPQQPAAEQGASNGSTMAAGAAAEPQAAAAEPQAPSAEPQAAAAAQPGVELLVAAAAAVESEQAGEQQQAAQTGKRQRQLHQQALEPAALGGSMPGSVGSHLSSIAEQQGGSVDGLHPDTPAAQDVHTHERGTCSSSSSGGAEPEHASDRAMQRGANQQQPKQQMHGSSGSSRRVATSAAAVAPTGAAAPKQTRSGRISKPRAPPPDDEPPQQQQQPRKLKRSRSGSSTSLCTEATSSEPCAKQPRISAAGSTIWQWQPQQQPQQLVRHSSHHMLPGTYQGTGGQLWRSSSSSSSMEHYSYSCPAGAEAAPQLMQHHSQLGGHGHQQPPAASVHISSAHARPPHQHHLAGLQAGSGQVLHGRSYVWHPATQQQPVLPPHHQQHQQQHQNPGLPEQLFAAHPRMQHHGRMVHSSSGAAPPDQQLWPPTGSSSRGRQCLPPAATVAAAAAAIGSVHCGASPLTLLLKQEGLLAQPEPEHPERSRFHFPSPGLGLPPFCSPLMGKSPFTFGRSPAGCSALLSPGLLGNAAAGAAVAPAAGLASSGMAARELSFPAGVCSIRQLHPHVSGGSGLLDPQLQHHQHQLSAHERAAEQLHEGALPPVHTGRQARTSQQLAAEQAWMTHTGVYGSGAHAYAHLHAPPSPALVYSASGLAGPPVSGPAGHAGLAGSTWL